jgi:hypothetical protein
MTLRVTLNVTLAAAPQTWLNRRLRWTRRVMTAIVPTPTRRPIRLQSLWSSTTKVTSNAISTSVYLPAGARRRQDG